MITSARPEEGADNPNGFILYTKSLRYLFTTRSGDGNIFTLVMDLRNIVFPKALELIAQWLDINENIQENYFDFIAFFYKFM